MRRRTKSDRGIFDSLKQKTAENLITIQGQPSNVKVRCSSPDHYSRETTNLTNITSDNENLVNLFDSASDEGYVLNLFIKVKDENGNWVDLEDEPDLGEGLLDVNNPDAEYLHAIIDGDADLDQGEAIEKELEAIADRLTPETEALFEQAVDAYAAYQVAQASALV